MAGNEDLDGDVSGEEAAWRDLVARFDQPVDTEAAQAPWPARENLTETARDRQRPDTQEGWDQGGRAGPASLPARPGGGLWPESGDQPGPGPEHGREQGREPGQEQGREAAAPGGAAPGPTAPGSTAPGSTTPGSTPAGRQEPPSGRRADRPRIIRRAGPGRPDQVAGRDEDDPDDRYIPPPPDPLPPLDPVAKGAWAGVIGGPGYLLIARIADWSTPSWAALLAIIAFVGGFATLVVRMNDHPRDDDDDGAVV